MDHGTEMKFDTTDNLQGLESFYVLWGAGIWKKKGEDLINACFS